MKICCKETYLSFKACYFTHSALLPGKLSCHNKPTQAFRIEC